MPNTPRAYYNEIDPYCAGWLYNLQRAKLIAPGDIDTRPIFILIRGAGPVPETYNGDNINMVLTVVERMTKNGDVQLSIMAHALVIACKSTKVDREVMVGEINRLWNRDDPLVPLALGQQGCDALHCAAAKNFGALFAPLKREQL